MPQRSPIRVVIADDEPMARRRLVRLLQQEPDVEIAAQCVGGRSAIAAINAGGIDLAFIDVQMPDVDGFGVLDEIELERLPYVVFVTAFDRFAIRAFDVNAMDYLLKPYDTVRFRKALQRVRERLSGAQSSGDKSDRPGEPEIQHNHLERIAVPVRGGMRVLRTRDIESVETDGNYLRLNVAGSRYMLRETAAQLETRLDPRQFIRIHRRFIVNIDKVHEVQPWFSGDAIVVMQSGSKLRLSRTHREAFYSIFAAGRFQAR
ncbi:MAG: LytTR family DNA-binding domain-containing protein [Gemmatimonadaceae bacterium]